MCTQHSMLTLGRRTHPEKKNERNIIGNADGTQYHQNTKQQKIRARTHKTTAETETETETEAT